MKKYGISLIVLIITVVVLGILATSVVVSLSGDNNIINQATQAVFKSDMSNLKSTYELYLVNRVMESKGNSAIFNKSQFNVKYTDAEFDAIFGDNMKDTYRPNLEIVNGKLVYNTEDEQELAILQDLDMIP